jgi:hypothetical protein
VSSTGLLTVAHRGAAGIKPGRDDAAFVQHQQVARVEQRRKIGKARIKQSAVRAAHHQHAALAALRGRLLRNQLDAQIEVEVGNAQTAHPPAFLK